ncbi:universal stress protein [Skermanella sp. TT6]|uniref:Universal stress protein n=1 Tax=Skermanella cutis TaxID=2775420 RepID=A0ABX7B8M9_9PROT|nr:universal stress protein [Skermanella sp. TT6]QQP89673.1 universal stress protein [Skermanella sp. TT6]
MSDPGTTASTTHQRIFLVVVDDSEELNIALTYACLRARNTGGRVALLYVIEPSDFQHWIAVEDIMREERRTEAEQVLQRHAKQVNEITGTLPILYVREGERRDELLGLINEEPSISILVLAAGTGPEGPGPLVTHLAGKGVGKLRIPLTLVPGSLRREQLDLIT